MRTWVLVIASAASFMAALGHAGRHHRADHHPPRPRRLDRAAREWTVNAYNLSLAVLLMTAAALGDRHGRRRTFAVGLLFAVASAASALASTVGWLIAARASRESAPRS